MNFLYEIYNYIKSKIKQRQGLKRDLLENALRQQISSNFSNKLTIHFNKKDKCNKSNTNPFVLRKYLKLIYEIKEDGNFENLFEYFRKKTNLFALRKYCNNKEIKKIR